MATTYTTAVQIPLLLLLTLTRWHRFISSSSYMKKKCSSDHCSIINQAVIKKKSLNRFFINLGCTHWLQDYAGISINIIPKPYWFLLERRWTVYNKTTSRDINTSKQCYYYLFENVFILPAVYEGSNVYLFIYWAPCQMETVGSYRTAGQSLIVVLYSETNTRVLCVKLFSKHEKLWEVTVYTFHWTDACHLE